MRTSYAHVERTLRELGEGSGALEVSASATDLRRPDPGRMARSYRAVTRWQGALYFIRRHPVLSGAGTFGVLAVAALLLMGRPGGMPTDVLNPVEVRANAGTGTLETYSEDLKKTLDLPVSRAEELITVERFGLSHSALADLDGDGRNELITVAPVVGEGDAGVRPLLIYSHDRRLRKSLLPGTAVRYGEREYAGPFNAGLLAVDDFAGTGGREMIVRTDNGRSPNAILRYSASGDVLGEYWHYGAIHALYAFDVNSDGRPEVVIAGQNDVSEDAGEAERFAFLAVLDPVRLRGRTASRSSPAFGLADSQAELLYMRFPATDMNFALNRGAFIRQVRRRVGADTPGWSVWYSGATGPTEELLFEYVLASDFSCLRVFSTDRTDHLHESLRAAGRVAGVVDSAYLEGLRRGVRYFDRDGWVKSPDRF
jgi:hypothetical protein